MAYTKEELKSRIEKAAATRDGKIRFGAELRNDIMEYVREQQVTGRSQQNIATELGMNGWTLNRWHQNKRKAANDGAPAFLEVTLKKRVQHSKTSAATVIEPAPAFDVMCPSGFEVRVPTSFESSALRRLLQTLEGQ